MSRAERSGLGDPRRLKGEAGWQEVGKRAGLVGYGPVGGSAGVEDEDRGGVRGELKQSLTAGATRRGRGVVEIDDRYGTQTDGGPKLSDSACHGGLFGTDGQAKARIFDVARSDDGTGMRLIQQQCGAHMEVRVRGVAARSGGPGAGA